MVKAFGYRSNGGPDVQEFLDLDMPTPMPGELLVEVRAAGVNPVDWKIRAGMLGAASESDLPAVLGSEVSGVVRGVGKDVDGFDENDEVFGSVAPGWAGTPSTPSSPQMPRPTSPFRCRSPMPPRCR